MPLGGIFSRSRGERSRGHSRTFSSPNTTSFTSDSEVPSTPRPNRTRARTLLTSPHTPLSKIFTSFGGRGGESWKKSLTLPPCIDSFARPNTASSAYSSSSNSSFESMHTIATECTIPDTYEEEEEDDFDDTEDEKDLPKLGPAFSEMTTSGMTSNFSAEEEKKKYQERETIGVRDADWTDEMDGHLWKTYLLYQNDPTVTPFYIPPGGVPPLGVCLRVVRVAKSTWKGSKNGGSRNALARAPVTPVKGEPRLAANKAELMRKSSTLKWPASESSTRKRLRLLCRRGYGPSTNPYHNHRQDPTQFRQLSRLGANRLPSGPLEPIVDDAEDSDISVGNALLASTRSMALSLATSTSVSMRPDSTMAAISGGSPLPNLAEIEAASRFSNHDQLPEFRGFTDANGNAPPVAVVLASIGLGHPVFPRDTPTITSTQSSHTPIYARRARANTTVVPPVGMSSLQLSSSLPSHGSWPRRGLLSEGTSEAADGFGGPLPSLNPSVRHSVQDLFDNIQPPPPPPPAEAKTPPTQAAPQTPPPRTRQRGYTVNIGPSNGMNGKRRARPSDISTPLPSRAYGDVEEDLDRAQFLGAPPRSAGAPRLGSPFMEDDTTSKWRPNSDSVEFGPPLPKKTISGLVIGQDSWRGAPKSNDEDVGRPMKRIRE